MTLSYQAKEKLATQVKILLLGSEGSGKSTVLKQMRLIHRIPFSSQEVEHFRCCIFNNLTHGIKHVLDWMEDMQLALSPENGEHSELIKNANELRDGEVFPQQFYEPFRRLWNDRYFQRAWEHRNGPMLQENLTYFFSDLGRLFRPGYVPSEQDIVHCRARTTGITEVVFQSGGHEMLMVDVSGQRTQARKWLHYFQDITSVLFLASLSGYDIYLNENKHANQLQSDMACFDSICRSQRFETTPIILFLNKNDLFQEKILRSDIKTFFPDFDGEPLDANSGIEYFKKCFARLAQTAGRSKERGIYIHVITATDIASLRAVMAAVEV